MTESFFILANPVEDNNLILFQLQNTQEDIHWKDEIQDKKSYIKH